MKNITRCPAAPLRSLAARLSRRSATRARTPSARNSSPRSAAQSAWDKARQFRFDFVVEREGKPIARFSHAWDRYTGDYRVSGTDKTGAPFAVYFNVNTKGRARRSSTASPRRARRTTRMLKNAYGRFINDTYWLLAPWKIFDPGVHLRLRRGEAVPGRRRDLRRPASSRSTTSA